MRMKDSAKTAVRVTRNIIIFFLVIRFLDWVIEPIRNFIPHMPSLGYTLIVSAVAALVVASLIDWIRKESSLSEKGVRQLRKALGWTIGITIVLSYMGEVVRDTSVKNIECITYDRGYQECE